MRLTTKRKKEIESILDQFPFVKWDRWVPFYDTRSGVEAYGWIDRADAYKDFLSLTIYDDGGLDYITSSAKYSLEIFKILGDGKGYGHRKCRRVEHDFKVKNAIRLS